MEGFDHGGHGIVERHAPTVGVDRLSRDVGGVVARQERGDRGDLLGLAGPAEGRAREDFAAAGVVCNTDLRASSVRIVPGPIATTRILCGASSTAATVVNWFNAPLVQA